MYFMIGFVFLYGIVIMFAIGIGNYYVNNLYVKYQREIITVKDTRLKYTQEMLGGIKIIKMNAWEDYFNKRICDQRDIELSWHKLAQLVNVYTNSLAWSTTAIVTSIIFTIFVLKDNTMHAAQIMTVVATIALIQEPIRMFPRYLNFISETYVSVKRIEKFLLTPDISMSHVLRDEGTGPEATRTETAITFKDVSFKWSGGDQNSSDDAKEREVGKKTKQIELDEIEQNRQRLLNDDVEVLKPATFSCTLSNITVEIGKGELIGVVGEYITTSCPESLVESAQVKHLYCKQFWVRSPWSAPVRSSYKDSLRTLHRSHGYKMLRFVRTLP
jgi:ATP-binding cassette subfamily C (CFTR/MRP) protein 10